MKRFVNLPRRAGLTGFRGSRDWYETNRPTEPAALRTFYVDATGGSDANPGTEAEPFQTTGKVNTTAIAGDLFYLKGSFSGYLRPSGSGTASNWITYRVWPGNSASVASNDVDFPSIYLTGRAYICVDGLSVSAGSYAGSGGGVLLWGGGNHCTITNCTFTGAPISIGNTGAVFNWIEGNTFTDIGDEAGNTGDGVFLFDGANDNTIYDNDFGRCGHTAITFGVAFDTDTPIYRNRAAYNRINNEWAGGINLNGWARDSVVECNEIKNLGTSVTSVALSRVGIFVTGETATVRYNKVWDCEREGIKLQAYVSAGKVQHCIDNHVYCNTLYNNGGPSISWHVVGDPTDMDFSGNTVENNLCWQGNRGTGEDGGHYNSSTFAFWLSLYGCSANTWTLWAPGGTRGLNGNILRNNIIANPEGTSQKWALYVGRSGQGNTEYDTVAAWNTAMGVTSNNQTAVDPLLTTAAGASFLAIATNSPAVDAGNVVAGLSYSGDAIDIGTYEAA